MSMRSFIAVLVAAVTAAGCTEPRATAPDEALVDGAGSGRPCELSISSLANNYFPSGHPARTTASDLDWACRARVQENITPLAFQMLDQVEAFLQNNGRGNASNGSDLVNALISCISTPCTRNGRPNLQFTGSLSHAGMFGLRRKDVNDADDVIARNWTPFGMGNAALWGVEVHPAKPWSVANESDWTIVFGAPVGNPNTLDDNLGLQYDIKRWPRYRRFTQDVYVGVCFLNDVELPGNRQPRVQREAVILAENDPGFCDDDETNPEPPAGLQMASFAASFATLARAVVPQNWGFQLVQTTTTRVPRVGGGALDFSKFTPLSANPLGRIEWNFVEPNNYRVGQRLSNIRVVARSGAGTPMELVAVEIYVAGNSGFPADAQLQPFDPNGDDSVRFGLTNEIDGSYTFPDLMLTKTGGFRICAKGTLDGFNFTEACSNLFNVRK